MRRELILKIIQSHPGISFNGIVRKTELSNGVVTHHILQLMRNEDIIKHGEKRGKYFDSNISKKNRDVFVIFRNNTNSEILKFLLKMNKPQSAEEISKAVNKSRSTISVCLKKLKKESLVEVKILNKNVKLASDLGYVISNKKSLKKFLEMCNI